MKNIEVRGIKGNWNEVFYGKGKNTIYVSNQKIELTDTEKEELENAKYNMTETKKEMVDLLNSIDVTIKEDELAENNKEIVKKLNKAIEYLKECKEDKEVYDELKSYMEEIKNVSYIKKFQMINNKIVFTINAELFEMR
jgi:hypothetical protein